MSARTRRTKRAAARAPGPGAGKRGAEGHIGYLLRQAQVAFRQACDGVLAGHGLTLPQFSVLTMLGAYGPRSGAALARLTLLTPQTIDVILRNLARKGAIARARDPRHGRIRLARLTAGGRRRLALAKRAVGAVERRTLAGRSAADEQVIRAWLVDIARRFMAAAAIRRPKPRRAFTVR